MLILLITLFGGIAILIFGLRLISENTENLAEEKFSKAIKRCVKSPIGGLLTGTVVAGVTQSSIAVNVIAVSLVEAGIISFTSSAAVIMGANVGTTVTAQLISLSGKSGTLIGSICSIIGLLAGLYKNSVVKKVGNAVMGLGLLFAGLGVMSSALKGLMQFSWFKEIFLSDNSLVLFLNGTVLTAITQSSSAVTGIIVILANENLINLKNAAFIILGSNVGSCFFVALSSLNKKVEAKRSAIFNLLFNFIGAVLFYVMLVLFGNKICSWFSSMGKSTGRSIADFHTVFNLVCSLLFFPFLNIFEKLIKKILPR